MSFVDQAFSIIFLLLALYGIGNVVADARDRAQAEQAREIRMDK